MFKRKILSTNDNFYGKKLQPINTQLPLFTHYKIFEKIKILLHFFCIDLIFS